MSTSDGTPAGAPVGPPVVVITGGARGIGASLSRDFAEAGARVAIADVLDEEGVALASALTADGREAFFRSTDVTSAESLDALVAETVERFGRIDALINNAAIYQGLGGKTPFSEISPELWDRVMSVNVKGVWLATRAVYETMKAQGYGRVVNVASATVHTGVPFFAHYTASKGAVIALTRSLAKEVGRDGITVNAVAPGLVDNESSAALNDKSYFPVLAQMRAIPRSMLPDDLSGVMKFLTSPASDFVTGQTIVVDGGVAFS
ncbi:SDR family oxidoreductase [Herbiconiux sp. VKM Ac-1786]|uniref:SDR family NAD(P)-dependent oxidoreductase n=1 Tax=Herbiconiux sp. VKM Ac-1786 TaxID=2783824 RepID=UPI00188B249C|nr:SDR family oxidoreductase [Herbiconiux sp. VKM Ac-1786]MBF4571855.1 SDR family oxidoreductase [Herbiconiux sp. VKM Ac-1786]